MDDGSLIIGGSTQGNWDGINQGQEDFMLLSLNASNGNLLSLEWQVSDLVLIPWKAGGEHSNIPTADLAVLNRYRVWMTRGNASRLRAAGVRFDGKGIRSCGTWSR